MLKRLLIVMTSVGLLTAAVLQLKTIAENRRHLARVAAQDEAALDDRHLDLVDLDATGWVRQYRPAASAGGYTLVLYRRRVPMIIDMNGRIVHVWPLVRAVGRARHNPDGSLAVIGTDNLVKEYDWDGRLKWAFRLAVEDDFPHHDLIRLDNGNYLVLARDRTNFTGYLQEVDRRGRVVWEWRSLDHIDSFPTWDHERKDPTHINSIHELPPNRHFDGGDKRFRPGNILVSARHLNVVFIIDKRSGEVVWQYTGNLDYQHEATMVAAGEPGEGRILVFNNGRRDRNGYRRSLIQSIEPTTGEIIWEYGSRFFFSSVAGTVQKVPGPNYVIASSHGGRIFEVTPDGGIVWEWVPPYMPMRPERLSYDHSPQLASIARPKETGVYSKKDGRPYIDIDLYRFALTEEFTTRDVAGHSRRLLRSLDECRELLMPPAANMWVEFGIDEERLQERSLEARFRLTVQREGGLPETVLDVTLNNGSKSPWRGRNVRLGRFSYQRVQMCVSAEVAGEMENPDEMVAWGNPLIRSPVHHPYDEQKQERVSEQEQKLREQQLKALGYVN
jgi:outer membrane protein assembly factor BamB